MDGLMIITMNTVIYSGEHTPDQSLLADPYGQFAWMRVVLKEAEDNGLKV